MTPAEFTAILARLGNPTARGLAALHGVPYGRATGWLTGKWPIPEPVAAWWRSADAWRADHPPPRQW